MPRRDRLQICVKLTNLNATGFLASFRVSGQPATELDKTVCPGAAKARFLPRQLGCDDCAVLGQPPEDAAVILPLSNALGHSTKAEFVATAPELRS